MLNSKLCISVPRAVLLTLVDILNCTGAYIFYNCDRKNLTDYDGTLVAAL